LSGILRAGRDHDTEEARTMLRGARVVRRRRLLCAAAVGGVAHRAGKHVDRGPADAGGRPGRMHDLEAPHERGVLNDEEFARQRQHALEG
jgi:hypothetical protein